MADTSEDPEISGASQGEAFQALYRRFRPQTFAELRGQEHVSLALRNAVRQGRVAHAYLLSGPRGTGKTSSARILAKALNCEQPVDGEPCGRCDSCRAIASGTSFDVHELDAASSNGVDAMRELVARASLATPGRWKVYIVDEVHMLSTAASNALLKTLEEPPGHVVFVLATTEPQKVLATIRSRTQHYEFHLLGDDVMEGLLADVALRAGLELPEGTIDVVSRRAKGSARDALSALDQVAAAGVLDDDSDELAALVAAIAGRDVAVVLGSLDAAVRAGRDPEQVAVELVDRLRGGFLALVAPSLAAAGRVGGSERDEADALGLARCVRTMELLGTALVAMRDAPEPRITLELALIRASLPEADDSPGAIVERLEHLERRVSQLAASAPLGASVPAAPVAPVPAPAMAPVAQREPAKPPTSPTASRAEPLPPSDGSAAISTVPAAQLPPPASPAPGGGLDAPGLEPERSAPSVRPALGSYRRRRSEEASAAPALQVTLESRPPEPGPEPGVLSTVVAGEDEGPPPAPPGAAEPLGAAVPLGAAEPLGAAVPSPSTAAKGNGAPGRTRDELVAAWGDVVLARLPLKLRAYYAAGRFVSAERDGDGRTSAVFAVPNAAHVVKAEPMRPEVERALSDHFGAPVALRLVADDDPESPGGAPAVPSGTSAPPDDGGLDEVAELLASEPVDEKDLPASGLAWAEGRLLEAFPGAEEI